jgi:protease-4
MRRFIVLSFALLLAPAGAPLAQAAPPDGKATVAVFDMHGSVGETPGNEMLSLFGDKPTSFKDLVARIRKAGDDEGVKAVVLLSDSTGLGAAQIEEVRQAIKHIRSKDKQVYAYADSLNMKDYVLISGSSRISVVPTGDVWAMGLNGSAPYIRGLLDKIDVKPEYLTCGAYKSAAEIFMRKGPSPEAERMQNWLLDSTFDTYVKLIAEGRGVSPDKVRAWINDGPYVAERAKKAGLIDAVEHRQDFQALLQQKFGREVVFNKKYGEKRPPKLDFSSPFAMFKIWGDLLGGGTKKKKGKNGIAIVYVDGPILLGKGEASLLGGVAAYSSPIRKALDEAARDDTVKAVVLRVDSPGGSAVASEIIMHATKRVKAKKPFVVSMGDVAGSGGYYVACGSDVIFADASTITGSIGVVAGKFVTTKMWNDIGITFKEYKRGKYADLLSSSRPFTPEERARVQKWMDDIYDVFKGHVEAIRGKRLKKPIDELAGGRVYTGKQALELGLVDKLGSLQDAIEYVAKEAKLTDYDVRVIPRPRNLLEELLEDAAGGKENPHELGTAPRRLTLRPNFSLLDLAMPYLRKLDPDRAAAVKTALLRLQLIQQEGVVMMMPEMLIGGR